MEATGSLEDDDRDLPVAPAAISQPAEVITGTEGPDDLSGTDEADQIDALGGDDVVAGLGGDDAISGGDGADQLRGGPGADTINGAAGSDTIVGGGGDDTLIGGADADFLRGKIGNDALSGGLGDDDLRGGGRDDQLNGDDGNDTLVGGGGNDVLVGGKDDDTLEGGNGDDQLRGGAGNDTLNGELGNDLLDGGGGEDMLIGGQGRDELRGSGGADVLDGKAGLDILIGGGGADVFAFTTSDGTGDRVLDFVKGEDRLDISELLPGFESGDDLDAFVQLEVIPQGTVVRIDPTGSGADFQLLVGLEGVSITSFTPAELGLGASLPGEATVISTNAAGDVANGVAFAPAISVDGQFVTFASIADNLVEGDSNAAYDVFRKDISTGDIDLITQIQVPGQGVLPTNGGSFFSAISANGEVVAFDSVAGNLSPVDTGQSNVFVNNVGEADPRLVSIIGNRFANDPSISDDGTLIAFNATATGRAETGDPAPLDTIINRVFVRDLGDGSLIEASSDAEGNYADGPSSDADISANGQFVVFESTAHNLLGTDTNPGADVYVKSLVDGTIENASSTAGGLQGFGNSTDATISGDGRFVAFETTARFVAEDFDSASDIYLKDMQTGELTLVTVNANGIKANGASLTPSISDDGHLIAFRSAADNLVAGDDNGRPDIFVFDTQNGEFARIELTSDTSTANPDLVAPTIAGDGTIVAYVDQVTAGGNGGLTAGQVMVAPAAGTGAGTLALADVLAADLEPVQGPAAGGAIAPAGQADGAAVAAAGASIQPAHGAAAVGAPLADLSSMVVQPDAA